MMHATTENSTFIHLEMGHHCHKHNILFIVYHLEEFDTLQNREKIRENLNRLERATHLILGERRETTCYCCVRLCYVREK
jgi:hypothetical protein